VSAIVSGGVATFTTLKLNSAGVYTLTASDASPALSSAASSSFTISPNAATQLVFGQQPTNATAGVALNPVVTVKIEDAFGNVVNSDNTDQVTIGIASGPGSIAGVSTTTVTASGGIAAFSNLVLDTAGAYTLSESASGGLTGPGSNSFQVVAA